MSLVFPVDDQSKRRLETQTHGVMKKKEFIILDGTWKEAKRILNKSDYLKNLPVISLTGSGISKYKFRRGAEIGQLCTYEAAMETLKLTGD